MQDKRVRYDCDCGYIQTAKEGASLVTCNRCGALLHTKTWGVHNPHPSGGIGRRIDPNHDITEEDEE